MYIWVLPGTSTAPDRRRNCKTSIAATNKPYPPNITQWNLTLQPVPETTSFLLQDSTVLDGNSPGIVQTAIHCTNSGYAKEKFKTYKTPRQNRLNQQALEYTHDDTCPSRTSPAPTQL